MLGVVVHHEWTRIDVARAFQPEICPFATGCLQVAAAGRGFAGRVSSREAAKPRKETQKLVFGVRSGEPRTEVRGCSSGCVVCGFGLVCGSVLRSVLGSVFPLTPDPSPPFHGGEGGLCV